MEIQGLMCNGCGSTDINFDPVTRKIHCNQCGKEEFYSRAQLGATGKVAFAKDNAIKFFKDGDRANARKFAEDVLNTMQDNASALFIIAYSDEFVEGRSDAIKNFFTKLDSIALERDEVMDLKNLFSISVYNLRDYESEMITLIIKNMQSSEDRNELETWIDTICSYCVSKYPSSDFLTKKRVELYCDLIKNCNIPKTCFALIKGIKINPDSPYTTNSFYMKSKTEYFLNHYIIPVGKIIKEMSPETNYSKKFLSAFNTLLNQYNNDSEKIN